MDSLSKPTTSCPVRRDGRRELRFALVVSRSTAPVPSAAWLYRFSTPARSDLKMIRRPSGVQSGSPSVARSEGQAPQRLPREIPDPDVVALLIDDVRAATRVPSGDMRGGP